MSKTCICVPSKGRAKTFVKYTLKFLAHTNVPWKVFVEPQDRQSYYQEIPEEFHTHIRVIPEDNQGMSYVLGSMRTHCRMQGYKFCFKMDDDVFHWYNNSRVTSKENQGKFLDAICNMVTIADVSLKDESNNSLLGGICFATKLYHQDWRPFTHVNTMLHGCYIVNVDDWRIIMNSHSSHEEFVASASLLEKGKVILKCGKFVWDADYSKLPGGFQSYDRVQQQLEDFELLELLYPSLMKYTQRRKYVQRTGEEFTVTDKTYFNRMNSVKLPLSEKSEGRFSKETELCLRRLMSQFSE